jgi:hypothetical protein
MTLAADNKISRTGHRQRSLSRLQPTEPMRQPPPTAVRVTRPDERPRTSPRVLAARQIDRSACAAGCIATVIVPGADGWLRWQRLLWIPVHDDTGGLRRTVWAATNDNPTRHSR